MTDDQERYWRRNAALLVLDYASFGVGVAFVGATTVLPDLVRQLGGGPLVVGSLLAIQSGGWLLPQLVASRYVANRPRVQRYMLLPAGASRALWALVAPMLLLCANTAPRLALIGLLVALAGLWVGDALASVPWYELVAKSIPVQRRGRIMGAAQTLCGLMGIGAGLLVQRALAQRAPFPRPNAAVAGMGALCFAVSFVALALIREVPGVTSGQAQPAWRDYLPRLTEIVRTDRRFAWLMVVRWLGGFADMGAAFYVLYAGERLGLPHSMVGLYISAGVAGGLLSGAVLGPLGDRKGRPKVIAVVMVLRALCPALALATPLLPGGQGWTAGAMLLVFGLSGMANGANMVGFMNYALEIAPPHERSTYVGLANTLGGLLVGAPMLGGWLVQVASYEWLFALSLGLAAVGIAATALGPQRMHRPGAMESSSADAGA